MKLNFLQTDFGIRKYMVRGYQKWKKIWFWGTGTPQRTRLKFWPFYLVKRPKLAVFSSLWWTFYLTIFSGSTFFLTYFVINNVEIMIRIFIITIFINFNTVEVINSNDWCKNEKTAISRPFCKHFFPSTLEVEENKVPLFFHFVA